MPRLSFDKNPKLRRHAGSGQGVVTLSGRDVYLGSWPAREKTAPAKVQDAYNQRIAAWRAGGRRPLLPAIDEDGLTVGELIVRFWVHVEQHYRHADGSPTSEVESYRLSFKHLRRLHETLPASEFSPLKLKAVREEMIKAGWVRTQINRHIGRIVRMFKWGVAEELIQETTHRALMAVRGLQRGRSNAKESAPVEPVADALVDTVLPYILPPVRAMIEIQRRTGMRPGEVCSMRACDLETSGPTWHYRPARHKTAWRGKQRIVSIGPLAQAILKPFLTLDIQASLFSPARALAERSAQRRAERKTPVQPSQRNRRKRSPKRKPREFYTVTAYAHAIAKACDRADLAERKEIEKAKAIAEGREPAKLPKKVPDDERMVKHWHPNQLRHNHATAIRKQFGIEAAQVTLGHARADVTQVYAERDLSLADKVAAQVG